jgi:hypothetical protein
MGDGGNQAIEESREVPLNPVQNQWSDTGATRGNLLGEEIAEHRVARQVSPEDGFQADAIPRRAARLEQDRIRNRACLRLPTLDAGETVTDGGGNGAAQALQVLRVFAATRIRKGIGPGENRLLDLRVP